MKKRAIFTLAACSLSSFAGCAGSGHCLSRRPSNGNLIFNPTSSHVALVDTSRNDWPAATDYSKLGEEVVYEVRIVDWQGRLGNNDSADQFYYRRFSSVRAGAARR